MKTWLNWYLRKKEDNIEGNAHSSKKMPGFTESKMTEAERRGQGEWEAHLPSKLTCIPAASQVTPLRKERLNGKQVETEVIMQIKSEVFKAKLYIITVNQYDN